MSTRTLPDRPNLDQLKRQADDLRRDHRARDLSAAARSVAHHPELKGLAPAAALDRPLTLVDAQLVVAREYGFSSWAALKHHVESLADLGRLTPHPRFPEALAAFDAGDIEALRRLIAADPTLVHARTNLDPPYHYFSGATLLHHVAGNPDRGLPLPRNVVEIARLLLDAGADVHARTPGPNGGPVMGLLVTSRRASDEEVTGPLMDLLLAHGARLDLHADDALDASLANHAPRAAEKMIALGANADAIASAALGRMDLLRAAFDRDGRLRVRPRRHGRTLHDRDAIGRALLFAYVRGQHEAVEFLLEKDGNWNVTGVENGTALHRAAWNGDLHMVQRLVSRGADLGVRDAAFGGSPLSWAEYNNQTTIVEWLQGHCRVDIHDAVAFGLRDHVDARLREDPASVNARRTQGDLPGATPLHVAAFARREELARLLLDRGADPALMADNGVTALDVADVRGATGIVTLLEAHGAVRSGTAARPSGHPQLKPFEALAKSVRDVYVSGAEAALARLQACFGGGLTAAEIRRAVQRRLQRPAASQSGDAETLALAEARDVVAGARGFGSWADLADSVLRKGRSWARPLYRIDRAERRLHVERPPDTDEWNAIVSTLVDERLERLHAPGLMTDAALERIAGIDHLTGLHIAQSRRVTDAGLRHLPRLPHLQWLDLSGCSFTDAGLRVLRDLPGLRAFELHWHKGASDAGIAHLAACERLERVDVMGSPLGDGLLRALAGKRHLRYLKTGTHTTDAGLPLLHEIPAFRAWQGGEPRYALMSADAEPNHLVLDGQFTDSGLATLTQLDGLFGLSFFRHATAFTPAGLAALAALPNLGFLGCEGKRCTDEAMRRIASIPRLRMLQAQGTVATDAGFTALSRSATLEYLWGRECPNLTGRGFEALASMPSLRGLAVSCRRVEDATLAALPRCPALRELMPMDVPDRGFRHVGACERLEGLWCMYCRDTTDAATAQIAGLRRLRTYYAGQTKITDRSLEILAGMPSLESLEFWNCAGITSAGAERLATLPRLREVSFDGCRHVGADVVALFPRHVRTRHTS